MTARASASALLALGFALAACGGAGAPGDLGTIGGTVRGLTGSGLTLQLNGRHDLTVSPGQDQFEFDAKVAAGARYVVTVSVAPVGPAQVCSIENGVGIVQGTVRSIVIVCSTTAFHVGGTVSGLDTVGLVLSSHGELLPIATNGGFTFPTAIASGARYAVTVPMTAPQRCTIENGSGTVVDSDVTNVRVTCHERTTSVWAVGKAGTIRHFDGAVWQSVPSGTTADLAAIWGSAADDIWAVGTAGTILHFDGVAWSDRGTGTTTHSLSGIWGSGRDDVWAVGAAGTTAHWDGASWETVNSGTSNSLEAISGTSASDVWAVGSSGTILHWSGSAWSQSPSGSTTVALRSVWARTPTDAWIAGMEFKQNYPGVLLRWSGPTAGWSPAPGVTGIPRAVWGWGEDEVWSAGGFYSTSVGVVGRRSGGSWSFQDIGADRRGDAISGCASEGALVDLWIVGSVPIRWNGSTWTAHPPTPAVELRAVWVRCP